MSKRFKFKLSLASFRFCRPKRLSSTVVNSHYLFSPFNPKTLDITYPAFFPSPPPTTPTCNYNPHPIDSKSKIAPLDSPTKLCNSPVTAQLHTWKYGNQKKKEKNDHGGCLFSNSEDEETETTNSRSFSLDSFNCHELFGTNKGSIYETTAYLKKCGGCGGGDGGRRRRESGCVVVKRSEEPYEDFKRSMLEMILVKEIFDAKDLEELLQCFLSLNSRHHHADIVAAFTDIWELLFF